MITQSKIDNSIYDVKNNLELMSSQLTYTEEWISYLEDIIIITQAE